MAELQEIIATIDADDQRVVDAEAAIRRLIDEANADASLNIEPAQRTLFDQFIEDLASELSPSNVARLDSFMVQAGDKGQNPLQRIALALSGWVLGSNNATNNFAVAQAMLTIRELVRDYLLEPDAGRRAAILSEIVKYEAGDPKTVAAIIAQMKPILHSEEIAKYTGEQPIEFDVLIPGAAVKPDPIRFRCVAHLPAQYDPYRKYPLLVSLVGRSSAEAQIDYFCGRFLPKLDTRIGPASRNGTIVVTVDWKTAGQNVAGYTAREHAVVLKATRQAMRMFAVDSDRVFLQGYGIGANLAYDVGLSHPDIWAGLIGISGSIERFAQIYSENSGVPLAIYSVAGAKDIRSIRKCKSAWNKWLSSQKLIDCTVALYKGRLNEALLDDVPQMFRWMRAQRRRHPDRAGFEFRCKSMRPWDTFFWFVELHGFPRKNTSWPEDWTPRGHDVLEITGEIRPQAFNQFYVGPSNAGSGMTLWLGPEYCDFEQPVEIRGRGRKFRDDVKPSTGVILEDVRQRADTMHPYWAKVDDLDGRWQARE